MKFGSEYICSRFQCKCILNECIYSLHTYVLDIYTLRDGIYSMFYIIWKNPAELIKIIRNTKEYMIINT